MSLGADIGPDINDEAIVKFEYRGSYLIQN